MARFFVAYDLNDPGQNYEAVHKHLKSLGAKRILESTWTLESELSAAKLLDSAGTAMDANDRILVVKEADWAIYRSMVETKDW